MTSSRGRRRCWRRWRAGRALQGCFCSGSSSHQAMSCRVRRRRAQNKKKGKNHGCLLVTPLGAARLRDRTAGCCWGAKKTERQADRQAGMCSEYTVVALQASCHGGILTFVPGCRPVPGCFTFAMPGPGFFAHPVCPAAPSVLRGLGRPQSRYHWLTGPRPGCVFSDGSCTRRPPLCIPDSWDCYGLLLPTFCRAQGALVMQPRRHADTKTHACVLRGWLYSCSCLLLHCISQPRVSMLLNPAPPTQRTHFLLASVLPTVFTFQDFPRS